MNRGSSWLRRSIGSLHGWRNAEWWRTRTQWTIERPWTVIATLAILGLTLRHAWLSTSPLSAGDWHWPDKQRVAGFFPWPSVWDSSLGLGGENRFQGAFRFPVYAISGLFAQLGLDWTISEKVIYFIPYAVLLPVAGWLLAREIMGTTRWALLTPVLLLGNTYFMLESGGEIPLVLAEVISLLALIAFLRALRRRSIGWALLNGVLVGATAVMDVRPAYLTVILMLLYLAVLTVAEPGWRLLGRRTALGAASGAAFAGTQLFWVVPLLTYHGNPGFPTPQLPNFNIITLSHGIAGVSAFWTGGPPAVLVQAPLNPLFMALPLLALLPLLARRLRPEVVWLSMAALLFAFFAKTNTPPLGSLYDWMYVHVPGWKLFREGSKFLYIVALAYAILIPMALRMATEGAASLRSHLARRLLRPGALAALVGVVAMSVWSVAALERGDLGSTTHPTPEPSSFSALSDVLGKDPQPGAVLWFGQPLETIDARNHHFLIGSPTHPAVNLTGSLNDTKINRRDPFQFFCENGLVPFCYVDPQLFPYLTRVTETRYVVVPGGSAIGSLPVGVTRSWLREQMAAMFGKPMALGRGESQLLVWRIASPEPTASGYPAIALVDGGAWATTSVLPALQAMDIPPAFRQTFDKDHYPSAPAALPDSVGIIPRTDGGCRSSAAATVAVMAQTTAPKVDLTVSGAAATLPLLTTSSRLPGWGVYGPFPMGAGLVAIANAGSASLGLGPCMVWTPLAATALGHHSSDIHDIQLGSQGERITASVSSGRAPWIELRRYFDPGWRLGSAKPDSAGTNLFNLYHAKSQGRSGAPKNQLVFEFSTVPWERIGQLLAALATGLALTLAFRDLRGRRVAVATATAEDAPPAMLHARLGRYIGAAGIILLLVTTAAVTIEWLGVPSSAVGTDIGADPYGLDVGYGSAALVMLLFSVIVRLAESRFGAGVAVGRPHRRSVSSRSSSAVALLVLGGALLLSACGGSTASPQALLTEAEQAGAIPPSIQGASLDDARLRRAAHEPLLCIADYTQALQDFPNLVRAYVGRGDCYLNGGKDAPAAVHDYSQAISLAPTDPDLLLKRAVARRSSGDQPGAIIDYQQAAANPSASPDQSQTAIDGLVALSQYETARSVYQTNLIRFPKSPAIHVAGASIAIATDQDALAAEEFRTAERLASTNHERAGVLSHQCHSELLRHEYTAAALDCDRAAHLSTDGSGAYDDLANAHLALHDLQRALADFDSAIGAFVGSIGPDAQPSGVDGFGLANLYEARGRLEIELHRPASALADFQRAEHSLPADAPNTRARLKADISTAKVD